MSSQHQPIHGACMMILAAICFAIINSLVQYTNMTWHVHSTTVALYQYGFALMVLLPWVFIHADRKLWQSQRVALHVLRVLFAVIGLQFWLWALAYPVPIWQAIAMLMLSPIFSTIGSRVVLGEQVGYSRWAATLCGFFGALLILEPWTAQFYWATLLPVCAAFFWSCCSMTVKKLSKTEDTITLILYLLVLTTPFNVAIAIPHWSVPHHVWVWVLLACAGLLTALAQFALVRAYTVADASFVQPFDHVKLPLNVLVSFLVLGTVPPGRLWLGAMIIIGSVVYITHYEQHKRRRISWRTLDSNNPPLDGVVRNR